MMSSLIGPRGKQESTAGSRMSKSGSFITEQDDVLPIVWPRGLLFIKPEQYAQVTNGPKWSHTDNDLGLYIDIPEGAVPEGSVLKLHYGMCLQGPFKISDGFSRISPVLMLRHNQNIQLKGSITIRIPIILNKAQDSDVQSFDIQVVKALIGSGDSEFSFSKKPKDTNLKLYNDGDFSFAEFTLSHFCFISLHANRILREKALNNNLYCICSLIPKSSSSARCFTYYLCITYYMPACLEAMKEQLKRNYILKGVRKFNIQSRVEKQYIKATLPEQVQGGWKPYINMADETNSKVIPVESVNFWDQNLEELKMDLEYFNYPPSVEIMVDREETRSKKRKPPQIMIKVLFEIGSYDAERIAQFSYVLDTDPQSQEDNEAIHHPKRRRLQFSEALQNLMQKFPTLSAKDLGQECSDQHINDIYMELKNWELVANHLGLKSNQIEDIKSNSSAQLKRLHTLQKWKSNECITGFATYQVLLEALLKSECNELAIRVCHLLV